MDLVEKLLALAASVAADGGDGVVRTLGAILTRVARFDAGEVAVARPIGFARWTLTEDDREIAAADLLFRLQSRGEPLRFDDVPQADSFPRTRASMRRLGLRSLLALPLSGAGGVEGAVVLACRQGWGFVGVPLAALVPAASMAGLCLARAHSLTELARKLADLSEGTARAQSALEAERRAREIAREELETLRRELGDARAAREAAEREWMR